MTRQVRPEVLPLTRSDPNSLGGRNAGALLGTGLDGFALYTALREARRASGAGASNYLVSWPYDPSILDAAASNPLTTQRLFLCPQLVPAGQSFDGVAWVQTVQGNYTPTNSNQVAAYTFDGTTFTRVGQSPSVNTLWAAAAGYQVQAFNTPVVASGVDRLIWAAGLWNRSAVVTIPQLAGPSNFAGAHDLGLGTYQLQIDLAGQLNMPATFLAAAATLGFTNHNWLAFYRNYT